MRISLEQPTFLTSLTEEKPTDNQTESSAGSDDFLDFSSTLSSQSTETSAASKTTTTTPTVSDEAAPLANNELTPEDLTNLLLGMGYLAETTTPKADDKPLELNEPSMDLTEATMDLENSALSVKQPNEVNALPNVSTAIPLTPQAPMDKKPVDLRKDVNELTKQADLLFKQAMSTEIKQSTNTTKEANEGLLLNTPTTTNVDNALDQRVAMSLQQMGAWLQTKVNADPTLTKDVHNLPSNVATLQAQLAATGGAATPAKAAWEAKVEVNQTMSNAELNLTTYHANIKIYPPELGKVTAKMKMDKNEATLEITAENKQVKALLQGHLNTLREQFSSSNITLNKIEIVLADHNALTDKPNDQREKQEAQEGFQVEPDEIKAPQPKITKKASENVVDAYV